MILNFLFVTYLVISVSKTFTCDVSVKKVNTCGQWEELTNEHGVKTYIRWLCKNDVKLVRERKGEFSADCTVDKAVSILTDASATKKWMAGVSENYKISQISPSVWSTYTLFDVPWPFNERVLISVYELKQINQSKFVTISINSEDSMINKKPDVEYLTNYSSKWTIKELTSGKVYINFSAVSNNPPMFPKYIQDPVIERIFHNNLVRLKKLLAENTYYD